MYELKNLIIGLRENIKKLMEETEKDEALEKLSHAYDLTIEAKTILECAEARAAGKPLSKLLADRISLTLDAVSRKEIETSSETAKDMLKAVVKIMEEIERDHVEKALEAARKEMRIPALDDYAKDAKRIY